jgi:tetratricopeptide (TPR) repeat protein
LELDYADHPDDPFILFNLGWTHLTMGNAPKTLGFLRQSPERSNPGDSIVRKIYALLAQTHLRLGQPGEALAACRAGRARYPQDDELLMMQGRLLEGTGNLAGAEACYRQLVNGPLFPVREDNYPRINTKRHEERKENNHGGHGHHGESCQALPLTTHDSPLTPPTAHDSPLTPQFSPAQFLSVEEGLRGYKGRFHLAMACRRQGKDKQAEEQLQALLAERPEFAPAWLELARLYFSQARWPELDQVLERLLGKDSDPRTITNEHEKVVSGQCRSRIEDGESKESPLVVPALAGKQYRLKAELQTASDSRSSILDSRSSAEAGVLKARGLLARKEFDPARQILEEIICHNPQWPYPRVILSYVFLQQEDLAAAERVLRDLLVLDPTQLEAWLNLAKLLRSQGRIPEALAACRSASVHCPHDLDLPGCTAPCSMKPET